MTRKSKKQTASKYNRVLIITKSLWLMGGKLLAIGGGKKCVEVRKMGKKRGIDSVASSQNDKDEQ